jgi:TrmH family RNA methyltransferase
METGNTQRIRTKNAAYQKFEVLLTNRNKRYKYNEFLIEGVRNINGAVQNGWRVVSFIYSDDKRLSAWAQGLLADTPTEVNYELADELMTALSGKEETSELLAILRMKDEIREIDYSPNPIVALFDRPSNKGNLGTMFRSCDALGVEGLLITGHAVDVYDPAVISSSMGSFFHVPFIRLSDNAGIDAYVDGLRRSYPGIQVIGTTAHSEKNIYGIDMTGPVLFLIGNETDGLNQHLTEICDVMATIPMSAGSSASSFNVGCAATVMFYEAVRQRAK